MSGGWFSFWWGRGFTKESNMSKRSISVKRQRREARAEQKAEAAKRIPFIGVLYPRRLNRYTIFPWWRNPKHNNAVTA